MLIANKLIVDRICQKIQIIYASSNCFDLNMIMSLHNLQILSINPLHSETIIPSLMLNDYINNID